MIHLANAFIGNAVFPHLSEIHSASQSLYRILSARWLEFSTLILRPQLTVLPDFQRKDVSKSSCCAFAVTLS